ncbi:MAG: CoA-binding protein [Deltaproteobacteria bacterium]|nr:MAG: CoA-binding protein [Deltaproteobacteria bacterium]
MSRLKEFKPIFYPRSMAVIGASGSASFKFGSMFLASLKGFGFKGEIYPVHPKADMILELKAYSNVRNIPSEVDFASISVPADIVPSVLEDCVEKGIKAVEIFTAGFSETGEEKKAELEKRIRTIAKESGIRVIGPNCFGVYCPASGLTLLPGYDFPKESGPVAFIGQSGGYAVNFCAEGKGMGLRFSKVVSYGNACDLNEVDFLKYLAEDPETEIITAYIEGVRDGRGFFQALKEITRVKPVIIWKVGFTEAGSRAVSSHTSSLAGEESIWDAVFSQTGAVRVNGMEELIDTTVAFLHLPGNIGTGISVVGGGGGIGAAGADAYEKAGFDLPPFKPKTQDRLRRLYQPAGTGIKNPLDTGAPIPPSRECLEAIAEDPGIDILVLYQFINFIAAGGSPEAMRETIAMQAGIKETYGKPIIAVLRPTPADVESLDAEQLWRKAKDMYLKADIPVYLSLERSAKALSKLRRYQRCLDETKTKI